MTFSTSGAQGQLTFRYERGGDGGLRVWLDALPRPAASTGGDDAGPVALNQDEAGEFGRLLAAITDLLVRAHQRAGGTSQPKSMAKAAPQSERPSKAPRRMRPRKPRPN